MELSSDNILTSSVTLYVHKKKSHHLPVGVCFHSKISWECQESTCLWPWWKVNSAVLVQPATHQAPRQICPALQGKEWKTDGSTESWEKEVGQDVLKGDKQWGRKVEGRQQPSRLRTVETFLICLMENLPVGAVSNFMEELQIFQRLSPLSQNSEDTAGNKQIPWQQRRLPCLSVPSPSRFLQLHLQTVQQLVVRCESFFFLMGSIPACTSVAWNTQLALRWIYVFPSSVRLTVLFQLQCLLCRDFISKLWIDAAPWGFAWVARLLCRLFHQVLCWNKSTFYSSHWESLFPALFSIFL